MLEFRGCLPSAAQAVAGLDVVVSLSDVPESFDRTLAEGKPAGRPVLAVRRGATPELVRHGVDGFLVEPGAVDEAAAFLLRLAEDAELRRRLGCAGREHATVNFSRQRFERALRRLHAGLPGRLSAPVRSFAAWRLRAGRPDDVQAHPLSAHLPSAKRSFANDETPVSAARPRRTVLARGVTRHLAYALRSRHARGMGTTRRCSPGSLQAAAAARCPRPSRAPAGV